MTRVIRLMQRIKVMTRRHEKEIFELADEFGVDPGAIMVKNLISNQLQ